MSVNKIIIQWEPRIASTGLRFGKTNIPILKLHGWLWNGACKPGSKHLQSNNACERVCGKHRKHFRPAGTITTSQWRGCRCSGSAGPELKTLSISLTNVKHLNARLICISVFLLLLRRFLLTLIYLLTNIFCNMLKVLFVISSQLHQTIRGQYFPVRQCLVQTLFTIYLIYFICFYANSS